MAIREILIVPDSRLKAVSQPVTAFDDDLRTLVTDMFDTMYDAPGIGLAAIQVGVAQRVVVIDLQPEDPDAEPVECDHDHGHGHEQGHGHDDGHTGGEGGHRHVHRPTRRDPRVFINPEVLEQSAELATYQEGCLSIPEIYADVDRPATCRIRYQDLDGAVHEEAMDGLMATCMQHELDHLDGVLFIDHLSRLKRQMALKKLQKLRQAA